MQAHRPFAHTTTCVFKEDTFKNELRVERLGSSPESSPTAPVPSRHAFLGDAASRQMAGRGLGDDTNHMELDSAEMKRHVSGPERDSTDLESELDEQGPERVLSAPGGSKTTFMRFTSEVRLNLPRTPTAKRRPTRHALGVNARSTFCARLDFVVSWASIQGGCGGKHTTVAQNAKHACGFVNV
jgi:hypothetical protein